MINPPTTCELPDLKIENLHRDEEEDDRSSNSSSESDEEDARLWKEEFERSGNFDFDFSKVRRTFHFHTVIFNESYFADEPETDRDFLEGLSKEAIKKRNKEEGTNLELVEVLRANYHPGGAITFYITFVARDTALPQDQPKTYQTMIGYLPMNLRIRYVRPKP